MIFDCCKKKKKLEIQTIQKHINTVETLYDIEIQQKITNLKNKIDRLEDKFEMLFNIERVRILINYDSNDNLSNINLKSPC